MAEGTLNKIKNKIMKNPTLHTMVVKAVNTPFYQRTFRSFFDSYDRKHPTAEMLELRELYAAHAADLQRVNDWLADDLSRKTLKQRILFKETKDKGFLDGIMDLEHQYFPLDEGGNPLLRMSHLNFIDCGAYTGDTIETLVANAGASFQSIVAFEPNKEHLEKMENFLCKQQILNYKLYAAGVYETDTVLYFEGDMGVNGRVLDKQENQPELIRVPVKALDSCPECKDADYIKMDIEGSEMSALKGAADIIRTNKPNLAICIYHKPEDVFEIPFYIKELNPAYELYIRHHSTFSAETVLYAIDREAEAKRI